MNKSNDFLLERRLQQLNKKLSKRFGDIVFSVQFVLKNYKMIFPNFTDHSSIHSINVIEFCNKIVSSQVDKLNADEIYCLLLACYLHDTGMGISLDDYIEFSRKIDFKDYFDTHSRSDVPTIIRNFHNEYSGLFVNKYSYFFELPSKEHLYAVIQICRGHRKVDLMNENEYPIDYKLPNGNTVCLPYLASILRLADEIDVTATRNCALDYDLKTMTNEMDLIEFMKHEAVKSLEVTEKEFIMKVETDDENIYKALENASKKMQKTLDICREAVNDRTSFKITQERIVLERI